MGHAGQSFGLACLSGKNLGAEDPRLLRDRPSDGAALAAKIIATFWGGFAGLCGYCEALYAGYGEILGYHGQQDNAKLHVAVGCEM